MNNTLNGSKKKFESVLNGLFFMIISTAIWTVIGETALKGRDHWIIGILFTLIVFSFIVFYIKFNTAVKKLSEEPAVIDSEEKSKSKRFIIIFIAEGLAIFIIKNVLANTGHDNWFIPSFALIVGLHFFPLAKVFGRNFDYFMATFVCLVAIIGFLLTIKGFPTYEVTPLVSTGCALTTTAYGIMMIQKGNKLIPQSKSYGA
jgi:hypothetical protein